MGSIMEEREAAREAGGEVERRGSTYAVESDSSVAVVRSRVRGDPGRRKRPRELLSLSLLGFFLSFSLSNAAAAAAAAAVREGEFVERERDRL